MSSSAINQSVFQAKIGSVQNDADSSAVYSAGVWSFKNSTAVTGVTITNAGNVGIGTTSPGAKLTVQGDVLLPFNNKIYGNAVSGSSKSFIELYNSSTGNLNIGTSFPTAAITFSTGTSDTERMRIDASGRLLVNPSLTHNGTSGIVSANGFGMRAGTGGSSSNVFNINWTGSAAQLWIDSVNNGTISLTSDYRVKKNVETQTLPALERIAQLRPIKYEYQDYKELFKADGIEREGFIAHELQAVIPSAVEGQKDDENQIQSLKLDALCSVMVKAIQEQQAIIDALEARLAALEAKP